MGIRAGVPPGAVRLESSRYGPGCDFSCAVSDPEPSPRPIVRSGGGRLRGFCDTRPGSIEASRHLRRCSDRGATSSVGVQRGAPTGGGPLGLRLGLCALRLARSRSFRSPDVRQKVADLQDIPAMARPGLEPGTPRFSGSRGRPVPSAKYLQIGALQAAIPRRDAGGCGRLRAGLGLQGGLEVPNDPRSTISWVRSSSSRRGIELRLWPFSRAFW